MGYKTYTCPIARECGGCEWLAVPYPIQLRRKQEAVEELLGAMCAQDGAVLHGIVGMDADSWAEAGFAPAAKAAARPAAGVAPCIPAALEPLAYRYKAATPFAPGKKGHVQSGFFARGTHRIVACESCLAEDPRCRSILNNVARVAQELHIHAYDEDKQTGSIRHAIVRVAAHTEECLLVVVASGESLANEQAFVQRMLELEPGITSIVLNTNPRRTNAMLGSKNRVLHGSGTAHDALLGCMFQMGPVSFFQTNPVQTEALYSIALDAVGKLLEGLDTGASGTAPRLLDTYCGVGTIGICAASRFENLQVEGVELGSEAVGFARRNAAAAGVENRVRFSCADSTQHMVDAARTGTDYDIVLLDPPRAGATPAFLAALAQLAPAGIVYVSCNPETQARDIAQLRDAGYKLESLTPVDMFPHTKHVECVALMLRKNA